MTKLEIRVTDLFKSFGATKVLRGVNLVVNSGEMVAIIGGSGCGKTTLLNLLTAQEKPDRGQILLVDHNSAEGLLVDLATLDESGLNRLRSNWAVVFQGNALFSGSVFDNLAFALRDVKHLDERVIMQRVRDAMAAVDLAPDKDLSLDVDELSGGMAKRVAIARALVLEPILIFYDEPTSGLDPRLTSEIHELIQRVHLKSSGSHVARTSVIVTHDRDLLHRLGPRIVMLYEGRVFFDGTYERFASSDSPIVRPYFESMPAFHLAAGKLDR